MRGFRACSVCEFQDASDSFLQFFRRFIGKCDGEDLPCGYPLRHEVCDPMGDRPGLSGAGTGEDEHRAFQRIDGQFLLVVQACEDRICVGGHVWAKE